MLLALGVCGSNVSTVSMYYEGSHSNQRHANRQMIQRVEQMLTECDSFWSFHENRSHQQIRLDAEVAL